MVIMPDCNVDKTIPAMMTSFFGNTGQRCLSGANLLVVGKDDVSTRLREQNRRGRSNIIIGYGLDESVQMGPVRDQGKKEQIIADIDSGVAEGARTDPGRSQKVQDRRQLSRHLLPRTDHL